MFNKLFLGLTLVLVMFSFQNCKNINNAQVKTEKDTSKNKQTDKSVEKIVSSSDSETWLPVIIEDCLAKAQPSAPIEIESLFNPYYLRANMDGNGIVDYVILVRKKDDKKIRGVLICKDSKKPYLFGKVSKSKVIFSDMRDDNFVSDNWEILSKEEPKTTYENKLEKEAKGESVGFFFDGGTFFIYWDGITFKGIGGA